MGQGVQKMQVSKDVVERIVKELDPDGCKKRQAWPVPMLFYKILGLDELLQRSKPYALLLHFNSRSEFFIFHKIFKKDPLRERV